MRIRVKSSLKLFLLMSQFTLIVLFVISSKSLASIHNTHYELAVIKDPIVDLGLHTPITHTPSASPEIKKCLRAHQGLHNELVQCLEQQGDCVKIACGNVVYGFDAEKRVLNTFWICKKHIALLKELRSDMARVIPSAGYAQEPTIVLTYPWEGFSVGTRFKHIAEHDTQEAYAIAYADYMKNHIIFDFVPRENAIPEIKQDSHSARKLFVKTINSLVDRVTRNGLNAVVPYVWGGSSFVYSYNQPDFWQHDGAWHRKGKADPYSGYDCSELVMRMAQIAGIDFPWKTTAVIQCSKRSLNHADNLEEGDLIWIQGHVMIISNIERNEIIEARSYSSGYGCVHRIALCDCFEGIANFDTLLEYYHANRPIRLKNKQGVILEKEYSLKLLKLVD